VKTQTTKVKERLATHFNKDFFKAESVASVNELFGIKVAENKNFSADSALKGTLTNKTQGFQYVPILLSKWAV